MKKINIALMILCGFAVIGLTGCGSNNDDDPAPVTTNPKPNPTDCSGFAGKYTGTATVPLGEKLTYMEDASITIGSNCGISGNLGNGTLNGTGSAHNLTSTAFDYSIKWNGTDIENGKCSYQQGVINCNGLIEATATKYDLAKSK